MKYSADPIYKDNRNLLIGDRVELIEYPDLIKYKKIGNLLFYMSGEWAGMWRKLGNSNVAKKNFKPIEVSRVLVNPFSNWKDFKEYFPLETLQYKLNQPFKVINQEGKFDVKVNVNGGGINGQADAIKLAIAKSLCEIDADNRTALKAEGLLTRDSRVVERKKPGQKKARKKFQWVKR